jgi:L-ascorbate metabolism protein UlaG (beta-lactamase superfamily)
VIFDDKMNQIGFILFMLISDEWIPLQHLNKLSMKILFIILIIMLAVILGFLFIGWVFSAPVYRGPVSDHFDGKKFINQGGVKPGGFKDLIKWARNRERGSWQEIKAAEYGPPPAAKIEGDSIVVTFVNHSTFLIQTQGLNILTDPVWCEYASPVSYAGPKRMRPPGIRFEDLPKIDIILLTHNHYDHLDIKTMKKLSDQIGPFICTPLGVGKYLERNGIGNITEMDWWDEVKIESGLSLICLPAQHFSGRGMFDRDRTLWSGFALMTEKGSIYYSGDTGYGGFFEDIGRRISPVRLAFLPIGAYKPSWFMAPIHTSPYDAVKIHKILKSQKSIGMHFGTFNLADEGQEDPAKDLKVAIEKEGISEEAFVVPEAGYKILIN